MAKKKAIELEVAEMADDAEAVTETTEDVPVTTPVVEETEVAEAASWSVSAARDLHIADDSSWDGPAAESSIFSWAGFDGDNPSSEKARRGFLVYDSSAPDLKGSYKLPFAKVQDGELVASKAGIRAAASRLPQTSIPPDVKDKANSVIEAYEKKAKIGMFAEMKDTFGAELRQGYPDVPIASDVNIEELTSVEKKNGVKPVFLTLPIARVGANGRGLYDFGDKQLPLHYDQSLVTEIKRGVVNQRPGGVMGHPDKHTMDTAFPIDQIIWVGAEQFGDTLWGKALIRDPQVAQYIRDRKSVNGKMATSILGKGDMIAEPTYARFADGTFRLRRIDLAPYDQASLDLGGQFNVTAEMAANDTVNNFQEKKEMATREEVLAYLNGATAEDIAALVGENGMAVSELIAAKNRKKVIPSDVAEMALSADTTIRQMKTVETEKDRKIAEMTTELKSFKEREFNTALESLIASKIDWHVTTERDKSVVAAVRGQMHDKVVAELKSDQDLHRAEVIIGEQMAGTFGVMLQMTRNGLAGTPAIIQGQNAEQTEADIRKKSLENAASLLGEYGYGKK